jgi:hypothetical protein
LILFWGLLLLLNNYKYRTGKPSVFGVQGIIPKFLAFFDSIFSIFFNFYPIFRFFSKKEHLLKKQKYLGGDRDRNCAFPTAKLTLYQLRHEGSRFSIRIGSR